MIVVGIMFFTLGTEISMTPMGERTGAAMTRSRRLWLVVLLSFILGFIITISEPDLQVLAQQVPSIPNRTLILCVAAGVGFFLVVALLRMLFGIPLPHMLVGFYAIVFLLVPLVPKSFLAVAFDSGGVTTGPMTVPFIMALGVGISATRNDRHAADDSFGLVALCSIGPILAVMVLGMIYRPQESAYTVPFLPEVGNSAQLGQMFWHAIPTYLGEIALSLAPIILFFGILQAVTLRLPWRNLRKIAVGLVYTYVGLVLYYGSVVLWVLVLFRMFSRNLYKRQAENQKWLQARSRRRGAASAAKARRADTEHKYFTCKRCKTICRVPVGKGKVIITCPKCGAEIHGKT